MRFEILKKITKALGLNEDTVDELIQQEKKEKQQEFEQWVNTPIKWHLIIRWMPAVYGEREIPTNITSEAEAVKYAKSVAIEYKSIVWLVLSRKENIQFDSNGIIKSRNEVTLDNSWLPATVVR